MKERDLAERIDVVYPYTKIGDSGKIIETFNEPPKYDV